MRLPGGDGSGRIRRGATSGVSSSGRRAFVLAGAALAVVVLVVGCASGGSTSNGAGGGSTSASLSASVVSSPEASSPSGSRVGASADSGTGSATGTGSDDVLASLSGRTFVSTEVTGHDLVPGSTITMTFPNAQTVSVNAGCNTMSGGASVEGGVLQVGPLATTQMGCPAPLMTQDAWLAALLTKGMAIEAQGETLVLSADEVTITLTDRKVAEPDLPFVGTDWLLDGIVANDAVTHYGVVATMSTDGSRINYLACNTHSGKITINGNTATTEMVLSTNMACADSRADVEKAMESVLDGTFTFAIDGKELTVTGSDGTGLMFTGRASGAMTSGATVSGATTSGATSGAASGTTAGSTEAMTPSTPVSPATSRPLGSMSITMPPRITMGRHDSIPPRPTRNTANETY